jgi:hypothetical protein
VSHKLRQAHPTESFLQVPILFCLGKHFRGDNSMRGCIFFIVGGSAAFSSLRARSNKLLWVTGWGSDSDRFRVLLFLSCDFLLLFFSHFGRHDPSQCIELHTLVPFILGGCETSWIVSKSVLGGQPVSKLLMKY